MIWLLFKSCGKKKRKSEKSVDKAKQIPYVNNSKTIIQEVLPEIDVVFNDLGECAHNKVFVTEKHFAYMSVIDNKKEDGDNKSIFEIIEVEPHAIDDKDEVNSLGDDIDAAMVINNRCTKVTEKHLKSLQCPFTWDLTPDEWEKDIVNRIENKYGKYNTSFHSITFSFEKYITNLIISCGLLKTNKVDEAHDRIIKTWEWLDKFENENESFYLSIRDGLKHIVMSTLCHILFTMNKVQCQQLFEMILQFNIMDLKSRAAVYAIHAAVCTEIGGKALQNAVISAKKACDLDSDINYWHYFYSVAMTAQRQYQNSNKSCPTEAEFDAVQHAIILSSEPNPYFNFHRMNLMKNKILYHYQLYHRINSINENPSEKTKQDLCNILGLIKTIISMEPGDPHLVVKCAKSIVTLPYFNEDNNHLIKQIFTIAVNMAFNDPTVIQAIKKSIEIYRVLVDVYKEIIEKKTINLKDVDVQNQVKDGNNDDDDDLENDFKLILIKHEKDKIDPVLNLINLFEKYDGNYKWRIMVQICSYSILFNGFNKLQDSVEKFMMLIEDTNIANSDLVANHRSIFIKDHSKVFNLAELMCNEIKLAITFGHIKNQNEIQFLLDNLTKITEVCQLKSKTVNPNFISKLIECNAEEEQKGEVSQNIDVEDNQQYNFLTIKPITSKYHNKQHQPKHTVKTQTRRSKFEEKRKNNKKYKNKNR